MYDNINLDKIVENYSLNCAWLDYTLKIYKKWVSNHMHISLLMYSFIFFSWSSKYFEWKWCKHSFYFETHNHNFIIQSSLIEVL